MDKKVKGRNGNDKEQPIELTIGMPAFFTMTPSFFLEISQFFHSRGKVL